MALQAKAHAVIEFEEAKTAEVEDEMETATAFEKYEDW